MADAGRAQMGAAEHGRQVGGSREAVVRQVREQVEARQGREEEQEARLRVVERLLEQQLTERQVSGFQRMNQKLQETNHHHLELIKAS